MGKVSSNYNIKHVRLNIERIDLMLDESIMQLVEQIKHTPKADLWASIPCTVWSMWQNMAVHKFGASYLSRLNKRRSASRKMLANFFIVAEAILRGGGTIAFEWPKSSKGWELPELQHFAQTHQLTFVECDGCSFGMTDENGHPFLKQWRIMTNNPRLVGNLGKHQCRHPREFRHTPVEGKYTAGTAFYPTDMCEVIISSFAPAEFARNIPAMACVPISEGVHPHRTKEGLHHESVAHVHAAVTRLIPRAEMI